MEKTLFGFLVLMLAGVAAAGAYVVVDHATRCDRFHFSAAAWRHPHGHRNEMAHRLVECHRLDGLEAQDVRQRLGKPAYRERLLTHDGYLWVYGAGIDRGLLLASYETLGVEVSSRGSVRDVSVSASED